MERDIFSLLKISVLNTFGKEAVSCMTTGCWVPCWVTVPIWPGSGWMPGWLDTALRRHRSMCCTICTIAVIRHLSVKSRPSTANGILDRMEEKDLLRRSVSASDGRKRLITLTEKGAGLQEGLRQKFEETEQLMTKGFSEEETAQLHELLRRVMANLEEDRDV